MELSGTRMRTPLAIAAALICTLDLSGCYFRNQRAFESRVQKRVAVGIPLRVAVAHLADIRLTCTTNNPAECTRIRQSLMPYSCVERVRLFWAEDAARPITRIEVPAIACAGL